MVHSTYLVDLRKEASRQLAFYPPHPEYRWALDDVIVFAYSARTAGEALHLCGQRRGGVRVRLGGGMFVGLYLQWKADVTESGNTSSHSFPLWSGNSSDVRESWGGTMLLLISIAVAF